MQGNNKIAVKDKNPSHNGQDKRVNKRRLRVSNQVTIDAVDPIPIKYGGTAFSFINQVSYLPFLPPDDNFAMMLLEARLLSVTHNACITTKKDYCAGVGFFDTNSKELDTNLVEWLKSVNRKNESCVKINKQIFEDRFTYGNVPIEIVRTSVLGKPKLYVYVHSFLEWRLVKPNVDDEVEYAIHSKMFLRHQYQYLTLEQLKKAKKLPIFNPLNTEKQNWQKDDNGGERTLIWFKNSVTGLPYYGLPSAVSSMIFQVLEYKAARYNLDDFDNSLVAAGVLALKGQLGQEEADRIGKKIIKAHTGDGKRHRTIVVASEEGIDGSDFHKMDSQKEGSYKDADDGWTQKIILANEWDAVLAGLVAPSTMGKGAGFLTKIMELKLNTVIRPEQNDLMDEVWRHIFQISIDWMGLKIDIDKISIKNSIDISGLTDVDITPAVTIDEVREAKGLAKVGGKKGDEFMTSPKSQGNKEGGNDVPA